MFYGTHTNFFTNSGYPIKKYSYPCTSLDRPWRLQEVEAPSIFRQFAHEDGKVVRPTHQLPLPFKENPW
jgi:hypothetical protein